MAEDNTITRVQIGTAGSLRELRELLAPFSDDCKLSGDHGGPIRIKYTKLAGRCARIEVET